jgi:hypothetical protein
MANGCQPIKAAGLFFGVVKLFRNLAWWVLDGSHLTLSLFQLGDAHLTLPPIATN